MDAERWLRVKDLFQAALEREPGQRDTFLRDACQDDEPLRETVAAMLARHPDAVEFFRTPALHAEAMALARDLEDAGGAPSERAPASVPRPETPPRRARRPTFPPWWVCLLAIAMGSENHEAILALGARRSEEPYTGEDLDALEAVTSSLGLLLDHPTPRPDRLTSAFAECPRCGTCYDTGCTACEKERAPLAQVNMPRVLAGRYRLEQRLGRGGMGKVYEAVDGALGRRVAVKVIRDEWVNSAQAAQRFRQEVRAVAGPRG
jgi:hypothetical protein